jgi:signal transduction histidine kinase
MANSVEPQSPDRNAREDSNMQQTEQTNELGGARRKRVEAVVETLATLRGKGESLAEVAHDARNMVTALGLYCDLLEEPGVLASPFVHYGSELRLVAAASRRLVEKLVSLDAHEVPATTGSTSTQRTPEKLSVEDLAAGRPQYDPFERGRFEAAGRWDLLPAMPIDNLATELLANRNLLAALAGPAIALTVDAEGGALPVRLNGEDLTRVLVNMVKNAAEAMPLGGRIQLGLRELPAIAGAVESLLLTIEDNGPGIPAEALEQIFSSGYTTNWKNAASSGGWAGCRRGLGLAITRSVVEAAGGRIHAANRTPAGARFEIMLPVATL